MSAQHSTHAVSGLPESIVKKHTAPSVDPAREQSPEFPEKHLDPQPKSNSPPANVMSIASEPEPRDSLSLHSMANVDHEDNSDKKFESPVPSSLEKNGADGAPLANDANKVLHPEEGASPSISTQGKTEESVNSEEAAAQRRRNVEEGMQAPVNAGKVEKLPGEQQLPSVASGPEISAHARQTEESGAVTEQTPKVGAAETTDPALENPELLKPLPPAKKSFFGRPRTRKIKEEELKKRVVIPGHLSKGIVDAIESAGVARDDGPRIKGVEAPDTPVLVFINSKSGGRLGPQLEAMLVDLITPTQVFDLNKRKPVDVLRYALEHLEKEADASDDAALGARNNMRIIVAGGDGSVGWVLGSILELVQKERFKVPPVAVIPLGTGNDLSRSFRWGGSTSAISRRAVRRWVTRALEADVATLDSWQVIVKPAPTRSNAPLKLPHALKPQHHIPLEDPGNDKEAPYFKGFFWNYFSLGMDAQVAYGFHNLRDEVPWLASGRVTNQMVYGGYGCAQGWFCAPCGTVPIARGVKQIVKVTVKRSQDVDSQWEELDLPSNIRAIVILNLQSYAGGRNPWGRPSSKKREKKGYVEARSNDGVLEIVGFRDGWHTAFVLLDIFKAVRLGQARAVKLELRGSDRRSKAYMQMDGEPWQQSLGLENERPAVVEISCSPVQSKCLFRK